MWGNVFEIQKNGKGIYVVKLPHSSWIGNENIEIFQKVKEEIDNQKQVIFRYENLLRQYDKALIKATTAPLQKDILDTLDPHFSNDETF